MKRLGVTAALALALAAPAYGALVGHHPAPPLKRGPAFLPPPLPGPRQLAALDMLPYALLQLAPGRADAARLVRRAGGTPVAPGLALWRLRSAAAGWLLPTLRREGAVRAIEPDRPLSTLGHLDQGDPLIPQEWWLQAVGADQSEPPGPGRPVTVVDSGVDLTHPEFVGRPDTVALNAQTTTGEGEFHGTGVASLVGAPANGLGLVGVYPQAALHLYDASPNGRLTLGGAVAGIEAAAHRGPGVINLSLGSPVRDFLLEEAVLEAFGEGSVVVAAAGNDRENGSPLTFPANLNHVLTVAATDEQDNVTVFSNASLGVDLAAPGQDIPIAVPASFDPSGYAVEDGTSFASPIVAGATAWVWTDRPSLDNTQMFDLMRFSAKDIGPAGFDADTGFGLLDIPQALAERAPASDLQEPNDDIDEVKAGGLFAQAATPLTTPMRTATTIEARLDFTEDPEDVYRVWAPPHRRLVVTLVPDENIDLELWGPQTTTVKERGTALRRDLLDASTNPGRRTDVVSVTNGGARGTYVYVDAFPGKGGLASGYRLGVRTTSAPR